MEKPHWRVRSSTFVIDSPYMRLRKDEVELPNGTVVHDYYVRESLGFVMVVPVTITQEVVLIRQYRYGNDSLGLEFPAGMLAPGEDPLDCAKRELAEETGFTSKRWEKLFVAAAEPVRSNAVMHAYLAYDCENTTAQSLDPTEHINVELETFAQTLQLLRTGTIGSLACVAIGYAAFDRLGAL
jgi:8-oxo-dGTP pyrophosphatase MutT (NUDIX family)